MIILLLPFLVLFSVLVPLSDTGAKMYPHNPYSIQEFTNNYIYGIGIDEICTDEKQEDEDGDGKPNCMDSQCRYHPACVQNPLDFGYAADTSDNITKFHNAWQSMFQFLIYTPPVIPEKKDGPGKLGTLYQSGVYYDRYQQRLDYSYKLLVDIEEEITRSLELACEICKCKQNKPLEICPLECNSYAPPCPA